VHLFFANKYRKKCAQLKTKEKKDEIKFHPLCNNNRERERDEQEKQTFSVCFVRFANNNNNNNININDHCPPDRYSLHFVFVSE
jgi:hypothetical protein